ncbi:MAG: 4'-phosphopantetheinyl transferase family protein [Chitinophagaceae bacterium]|jgi:phosphopantetheinyl transferase
MPLFFQQNINEETSLGIWSIEEDEDFFLEYASIQRDISHPQKRKQHLAGRYLLNVLSPGFPLAEVKIAETRKPFLPEDLFHFSISHADNYAAAVVSKSERVGVDVEIYTSRVMKVLHKFLTDQEKALLSTLVAAPYVLETLLWSVKESVFKWNGSTNVDFKEHIIIKSIQQIDHTHFAIAVLYRDKPLDVKGMCFPNFCLTWVAAA